MNVFRKGEDNAKPGRIYDLAGSSAAAARASETLV